jgi:phosphotransferase system HPr (HPr) family protein
MTFESDFFEEVLRVTNQLGLHARVATMMVKAMRNFECRVTVTKDNVEADARSVLGLLLLAATSGSEIRVRAQGPGSREAVREIGRLVQEQDF